jgi:hypothetical protein
MHPTLPTKIFIVLIVLVTISLLAKMARFLIPFIILAVIIGWLWDLFDKNGGRRNYTKYNDFDDYEEL